MGGIPSLHRSRPSSRKVLILGLEGSGKTSIHQRLTLGIFPDQPQRTIGHNVEHFDFNRSSYELYDLPGQKKLRSLWRLYLEGTEAFIFVIDATDGDDRIFQARDEIRNLALTISSESDWHHHHRHPIPLLVFLNKLDQDQDMARLLQQTRSLESKLELDRLQEGGGVGDEDRANLFTVHIQSCDAKAGVGLMEGFQWLDQVLDEQRRRGRGVSVLDVCCGGGRRGSHRTSTMSSSSPSKKSARVRKESVTSPETLALRIQRMSSLGGIGSVGGGGSATSGAYASVSS